MFTKSVIATLLSVGISASAAQAGLFGYAFNKLGDTNTSSNPNPCNSETFNKNYGQYCSGMFTKTIRCLSDGSNPGVCDSAAVCDTLDRTAKNLCETHCLNTTPQKMGNQSIKLSCAPNPNVQENMKGINLEGPTQDEQIQALNQPEMDAIELIENEISVDPFMQPGRNSEMKTDTEMGMDSGAIKGNGIPTDTMGIRGPNEGSQDGQTVEANIYQTEHPKSFDQITTEQPWNITPDLSFAVEGNLGKGITPHHHGQPSVTVGGTLSRQAEKPDSELANLEGSNIDEGVVMSTYPLDEIDQPTAFQSTDVQGSPVNAWESVPADFERYTSSAYQNLRNYQFYSMPD